MPHPGTDFEMNHGKKGKAIKLSRDQARYVTNNNIEKDRLPCSSDTRNGPANKNLISLGRGDSRTCAQGDGMRGVDVATE